VTAAFAADHMHNEALNAPAAMVESVLTDMTFSLKEASLIYAC
jgi:hypothetical protein